MTFTFSAALTTDRDKVRFYTGDTTESESYLSDELITGVLTVEGTYQKATVACILYIITQLSDPDFRADWLNVSNSKAREGWLRLLDEMRRKFNIAAVTATAVHTYRADSLQSAAPDYTTAEYSEDV